MSGTFAASALRLAGLVPRTLGWLPQHFWETTPAELTAIFAAEDPAGEDPLTRSELDALLEREANG